MQTAEDLMQELGDRSPDMILLEDEKWRFEQAVRIAQIQAFEDIATAIRNNCS